MANETSIPRDEELARQCQAGSLSDFDELIRRYHRRIYAFVAQSCSNAADAAEITQETFIKAFQAIGTFNPRCSFAAWLFTIARRKCIDHYRAARAVNGAEMPDLPDWRTPAALAEQREARSGLWTEARRILPEAQFQALWLKYAEEMSIEQTAAVLRKTRTHVKVLLFRARRALAREMPLAGRTASVQTTVVAEPPRSSMAGPAGRQPATRRASVPLAIRIAADKLLL